MLQKVHPHSCRPRRSGISSAGGPAEGPRRRRWRPGECRSDPGKKGRVQKIVTGDPPHSSCVDLHQTKSSLWPTMSSRETALPPGSSRRAPGLILCCTGLSDLEMSFLWDGRFAGAGMRIPAKAKATVACSARRNCAVYASARTRRRARLERNSRTSVRLREFDDKRQRGLGLWRPPI